MATEFKDLQDRLLALPTDERAKLAGQLLASLDSQDDVNAETRWLDEAERRYQAYREGKLESEPANQVFADAFKHLS